MLKKKTNEMLFKIVFFLSLSLSPVYYYELFINHL